MMRPIRCRLQPNGDLFRFWRGILSMQTRPDGSCSWYHQTGHQQGQQAAITGCDHRVNALLPATEAADLVIGAARRLSQCQCYKNGQTACRQDYQA